MANANLVLRQAKRQKKDEFYTQMSDIARELGHYQDHFEGKSVLLNCDDPQRSNFWKYFERNFESLGLSRLVSTHYRPTGQTYKMVMERDEDGDIAMTKTPLCGNGDFRSSECERLLDEADIITTNPPFSLFREYVGQLMGHEKKFLVIGNQNAIAYKEIFPYIKSNELWLGYGFPRNVALFESPYEDTSSEHVAEGLIRVPGVMWFTNLDIDKRHRPIALSRSYEPSEYPRYDNYDAIEVSRVADIPCDYYGVMGVPITFMDKYCPEQFRIIGLDRYTVPKESLVGGRVAVNGRPKYARILIQRVDQPDATEA